MHNGGLPGPVRGGSIVSVKRLSVKANVAASVAALALVGAAVLVVTAQAAPHHAKSLAKTPARTATLTQAGHAGRAGAPAATPPCGTSCISLYNVEQGTSYALAVQGGTAKSGQAIVLSPATNSNSAEDWTYSAEGTVYQYYLAGAAGGISPAFDLDYSADELYEFQYSPDGVTSGLCLGLAATAANNSKVTLQPCGPNSLTLWAAAAADQSGRTVPLINGSDTNFSTPYVLQAASTGTQLVTASLAEDDGVVNDDQMWASEFGPL
jgi:hypothetical protein